MKIMSVIALSAAVLTAGCAQQVHSTVEAHSAIREDVTGRSVYVRPMQGMDPKSLQFRQAAGSLYSEFEKKGMLRASSPANADYVATFGYAIDNGERITESYSVPIYGQTGVSSSRTTGYVHGNVVSANTSSTPSYGITGYSTGTRTRTEYDRAVALSIVEKRSGQVVFEALTTSAGSCGSISVVVDEIVEATLSEFPNGKQGKVIVPMDGSC